jgi:hypothetical protein
MNYRRYNSSQVSQSGGYSLATGRGLPPSLKTSRKMMTNGELLGAGVSLSENRFTKLDEVI